MRFVPRYELAPALLVFLLAATLVALMFVPTPVAAHAHDRHADLLVRLLAGDLG